MRADTAIVQHLGHALWPVAREDAGRGVILDRAQRHALQRSNRQRSHQRDTHYSHYSESSFVSLTVGSIRNPKSESWCRNRPRSMFGTNPVSGPHRHQQQLGSEQLGIGPRQRERTQAQDGDPN